mmetsp:Transcript_23097/g.54902  ORF Transcript_23097/g.54902 Transcript_23097/m.54902 type:complete len:251 (+) Transcript_23097:3-755(+)
MLLRRGACSQALLRTFFSPANRIVTDSPRAKSTIASEPPFDPEVWVKKAEKFADDKSKVALLALELLHNAEVLARKEKEAETAKKEAEAQVAKKEVEVAKKATEFAKLEGEFNLVNHRYLQASSAMTSRGVLEFLLRGVYRELNLKGNFNASQTCTELDRAAQKSRNGLWFQALESCYQQAKTKHKRGPLGKLSMGQAFVALYGELSKEIHGEGWSGPHVQVLKSKMKTPEHVTLVECLVLRMGLEPDYS